MGVRYAKNIGQNMDAWDQRVREVNQAYPFTPPDDPFTEEDRFATFLNIREQAVAAAEDKLDWLFVFIQQKEKPNWFDLAKIGLKFVHFFSVLGEIGLDLTNELDRNQMSVREYAYLTRLTMGTLYQWKNQEANDERNAVWNRYMQPIHEINDKAERIEKENPGTKVDISPLHRNRILGMMESFPEPGEEMQNLVFAHHAKVTASTSAVFVDVFIVERD